MFWLMVLIVAVPALLELIAELFGHGLREIGPWALTRRTDGTFSRWQIAGQILVVGGPSLVCHAVAVNWLVGVVRNIWQG